MSTVPASPAAVARIRDEVRRALRRLPAAIIAGPALVIAVSGGVDSVCLCDAILALAGEFGLAPVVAHLNHGLRGEDARADAAFVRDLAAMHGAAAVVEEADVAGRARDERVSIEVAARAARYEFLARAARRAGATAIALAHHADDQAETVLLRLIRGTGVEGLRGMRACSPHPLAPDLALIRPLLRLTRAQIEAYCLARQLPWRHDATNDDTHHLRNRVRHELLPMLERYNPGIRKGLARLADTAAADHDIIEHAARQAFEQTRIADTAGSGLVFDRAAWQALPESLQRLVLRQAVAHLCGDLTDLKYAGIEEARHVLNSQAAAGEIALTGRLRIHVSAGRFRLGLCPPAASL